MAEEDKGDAGDDDLLLADLPQGDCSEVESIRWVANNISRMDVDSSACPSAIAWTLLLECRDSPAFRVEFLTKMWPKLLPTKAQMENDDGPAELDGQATMDLIDRIAKVRDDLVPKVEEPKYDTFEEFSQDG